MFLLYQTYKNSTNGWVAGEIAEHLGQIAFLVEPTSLVSITWYDY